jgi:predicted dienelactone hydrolase
VWDADLGIRLDIAVWYPSLRPPRRFVLDGRQVTAGRNSPAAQGTFPLVLASHDAASNRFSLSSVAASLARQGFVVVAPTHPRDNTDDASGLYRADLLHERPLHLLMALESVLRSPNAAPSVDTQRIGLLGVGSGSATVLQLLGLSPDPELLVRYCADEPNFDIYCTPWAQRHFPAMARNYRALAARLGENAFTPTRSSMLALQRAAHKRTEETDAGLDSPDLKQDNGAVPAAQRADTTGNAVPMEDANDFFSGEIRFRAAVLFTPGLSALFVGQSLPFPSIPMAVISAGEDDIYPARRNTTLLRGILPPATRYLELPAISHFSLAGACQNTGMEPYAPRCDTNSFQVDTLHQQRDLFLADFFHTAFSRPFPAAEPVLSPKDPPANRNTSTRAVHDTAEAGDTVRADDPARPASSLSAGKGGNGTGASRRLRNPAR